jgi:predicted RNase H-like HicB family nuclease
MEGGTTMLSIYPACFFKENKGYSVVFPDLNWLATSGKNENEAMKMAVECLAGYLYVLEKDGDKLPKPSAMSKVDIKKIAKELDADLEGSFVNMVSVDVEEYAKAHFEKAVRKTLTIPAWLNNVAQEKHINFSQTLQEALLAKIKM